MGKTGEVYVIMLLTAVLASFGLTGCSAIPDEPEKLSIGTETYVTGFYGDLFPHKFDYAEEQGQAGEQEYRRIDYDGFDLIHTSSGLYSEGTIYCNERQLEEARSYYSDPDNYCYFCRVGVEKEGSSPLLIDLEDVDTKMFDALIGFAEENGYQPFASGQNEKVKMVEMPMPDETKSPVLIFYKESKDGMFTSGKGVKFHIIDGALMLVYYYDYGHGEYEKLVAVRTPDEISNYMVDFLEANFRVADEANER